MHGLKSLVSFLSKYLLRNLKLVGEIAVILGSFIFFSCLFLVIKSTSISKLLSTRAGRQPAHPKAQDGGANFAARTRDHQ